MSNFHVKPTIDLYILRNKNGLYVGRNSIVTDTPTLRNYWFRKIGGENLDDMKVWKQYKREDFYWEKVKYIFKGQYVEK
jgi:hypothetical protein